jgi:ribosomal protein S18 acetylase RimI-like enzyme
MFLDDRRNDRINVNVRQSTIEDIDQVSELMQELLGDPIFGRENIFKKSLSSKNYIPLVAEINGNIVGFLDIWHFPDVGHGAKLGVIENFIVTERHRKMGVGGKLLEESIKIARKEKFHELHVWTEFKNENAIKMYRKHGFINENLLLEREFG